MATGPRVKLVDCKSALTSPVVYSTDRSKAVDPLLLCGLFYEAICFKSCLVLFCSCIFSPFSIAITSLGEERANLCAFRTFVRFELVWFCLPLGVWEGLRCVIVAHPGLFSYFLFEFLSESAILTCKTKRYYNLYRAEYRISNSVPTAHYLCKSILSDKRNHFFVTFFFFFFFFFFFTNAMD